MRVKHKHELFFTDDEIVARGPKFPQGARGLPGGAPRWRRCWLRPILCTRAARKILPEDVYISVYIRLFVHMSDMLRCRFKTVKRIRCGVSSHRPGHHHLVYIDSMQSFYFYGNETVFLNSHRVTLNSGVKCNGEFWTNTP